MNNYNKYSDEKLLELLREKSPLFDYAFDAIFNRYGAKLNAYCIFKMENRLDAEEVFEDTWLKFLDRIKQGIVLPNILPYLYTIAKNLITDRFRHKNSQKNITIEYNDFTNLDEQISSFSLEEQLDNQELMTLINIALSNLDSIYRDTFVMFWFGGLSHKEISEIMQISISAVKMRSHRAMNELTKMLKPYFADLSK
jgi:RNA polymerase sigma-70 factor (ECF subfamily)